MKIDQAIFEHLGGSECCRPGLLLGRRFGIKRILQGVSPTDLPKATAPWPFRSAAQWEPSVAASRRPGAAVDHGAGKDRDAMAILSRLMRDGENGFSGTRLLFQDLRDPWGHIAVRLPESDGRRGFMLKHVRVPPTLQNAPGSTIIPSAMIFLPLRKLPIFRLVGTHS